MATIIEGITLYRIPEVAQTLQVTPQTVRLYLKQGRLKGVRVGRPILITDNSLREFLGEPVIVRTSQNVTLQK